MEQKNFINITLISSENDNIYPSPEPAPLSQSYIIPAENVQRYNPTCTINDLCIKIVVNDHLQNTNYRIELDQTSDYWKANNKYFQNDIKIFYNFIHSFFLKEKSDEYFIQKNDHLKFKMIQEGLFPINLTLDIPKEDSNDIKQELYNLQSKIERLEYFITTMIYQTNLGKTTLSDDWKEEQSENSIESIPTDLDDLWDKIDECYSQSKN